MRIPVTGVAGGPSTGGTTMVPAPRAAASIKARAGLIPDLSGEAGRREGNPGPSDADRRF
jgi:hypothetical protein